AGSTANGRRWAQPLTAATIIANGQSQARRAHRWGELLAATAHFSQHAQASLGFSDIGVLFVPGIAGKYRADHPANLRLGVFVVDDVLEAAIVPTLNVGPEGIHATLERHG